MRSVLFLRSYYFRSSWLLPNYFAEVHLGNVPFNISEEELEAAFNKYGEIVSITIPKTESGKARGYAFIEFDKSVFAKNALDENGSIIIKGRKIYVNKCNNRKHLQ